MIGIRYAVIGAGSAGRAHLRQAQTIPGLTIVGVADPAPRERWRAADAIVHSAACFEDPAIMLDSLRPDVVSICTPTCFHAAQVRMAFQANAHVLCEKPMGLTLQEAFSMEQARAEAGRQGAINFVQRTGPAVRFIRDLVRSGEIGPLRRVTAAYLQSFQSASDSWWTWRNNDAMAGFGALGDLGAHVIDAIRYVTGAEFSAVSCRAQIQVPLKPVGSGQMRPVTTDTNAAFLAELSGEVLAIVEVSQVATAYGDTFRLELTGDLGTVSMDSEHPDRVRMAVGRTLTGRGTWTTDIPFHRLPTEYAGVSRSVLAELVRSVRGGGGDPPRFQDGIRTQAVLAALEEAASSRRWCQVPAA